MDLAKVIYELHEELEHLNAAIISLERLQEAAQRGRSSDVLGEMDKPNRGRRRRKSDLKADEAHVE